MGSTWIIILSIMFFCTTTVSAFNITRLLNNHPQFSTFNDLLTQTGVAEDINVRQTITVLVIANTGMGPITSKPQPTIKKIIQTHVLLEYCDVTYINTFSKNNTNITNLFQTSSVASQGQGYTNIINSNGEAVFVSMANGAPHDSKMTQSVAAQPYNISVIQISQPIVTPGIDQTASGSSGSTTPVSGSSGSPMTAPTAPPHKKGNQTEAPAPEDDGSSDDSDDDSSTDDASAAPEDDVADKDVTAKDVTAHKNSAAQMTVNGAVVLALAGLLGLN